MVETSLSNAGAVCSITDQGAKILHVSWPKNIKQKEYCIKFNKDLNGPHFKKNSKSNVINVL